MKYIYIFVSNLVKYRNDKDAYDNLKVLKTKNLSSHYYIDLFFVAP